MADLVIEVIGPSLNPELSDASAFRLTATNARGAAMLRGWVDLTTRWPSTAGRIFITLLLTQEALEDIIRRAELAGVTVELPERHPSS